jgi:carbon monoxide dehydrogenase subunit G
MLRENGDNKMTRLESDKATINKPAEEIYTFLSDFNNFGHLMPEQISDWQSTADECSFTIKGMAELGMKMVEKVPYSLIKIAKTKAPFDFILSCTIEDKGPQCEVQLAFDANLNPMLKMMASKPLTNFLNMLVNKLKEVQSA